MDMEDDCAGSSNMSKRLSESLAVIRALSDERIQELTDAKTALDISFANLFRNRMKLGSSSYPDSLCNATDQPSPSRDRVRSFTCRTEHEKSLTNEEEKKMKQINATFHSGGHTDTMSKTPVVTVTDDDVVERCKEDQTELTDAVSKAIDCRLRLDELPTEDQSDAKQSPTGTIPSGGSVNDTMMRDYLSRVQRIAPSAYVLDLLKHRLNDDTTDTNSRKTRQPASSEDGYNQPMGDRLSDPRKGSIGPANRRVVVIGQGPTVSPHPKKRFSTRTILNERDMVMLKRRCVAN